MYRFTPTTEVELCGHATLASAHALYSSGKVKSRDTPIRFFTNFGEILVAEGKPNGFIQLNFPVTAPIEVILSHKELIDLLIGLSIEGGDILYAGRSVYDLFVEITVDAFARLDLIDFDKLKRLGGRGIIVTCRGTERGQDFSSRWFGPRYPIHVYIFHFHF